MLRMYIDDREGMAGGGEGIERTGRLDGYVGSTYDGD